MLRTISPNDSTVCAAVGGGQNESGSKRARVAEHVEEIEDDKSPEEMIDEAIAPKVIKQPTAPTTEMWIEHKLTHTPFCAWCPICVQAKAKNTPHRKKKKKKNAR